MKTSSTFSAVGLAMAMLVLSMATAMADIQVRLSVKFIKNSDGSRPTGGIATTAGFDAEVLRGNNLLDGTGRGYRLTVVEYIDIQPPAPNGQLASYWYTLPARSNRQTFETAALADQATWRWNPNAINIYVNNSASGQCSFVGTGGSISLGGSVGAGTVLHECGHIFNLKHTHAGDYSSNTNPTNGVFTTSDLQDGDGLVETVNDNPNISNHDQLSQALFGVNYGTATGSQQAVVDSAYENVMSYHNENVLFPVQMDILTMNANGPRLGFCTGSTWFVAIGGSDGNSGDNVGSPFATISRAALSVGTPNDIIMFRNGGTFSAPANYTINFPCTLRATGGSATVN